MSRNQYDVIVVGARCAGSPTATLLARKGCKVLLVDRATFPSDTVSTHAVHTPGVAALKRWGLLDRLKATGCPPISTYAFDFGSAAIAGTPALEHAPVAYAPRRTVLDKLLVDAASEAGVEVREEFSVHEVHVEGDRVAGIRGRGKGGTAVLERARLVIGADGLHSTVARAVQAEQYHERPRLEAAYYSYWSGLPMNGRVETYVRPGRAFTAFPTHDDLTLIVGCWPYAEFHAHRTNVESTFTAMFDMVPSFAERMGAATREARFVGAAIPNFFRKPYGPGWALVGDAGYTRDAVTAQGISDAFHDAEMCATAVDEALSGSRSYSDAMEAWHSARDARVLPMYDFTCELARCGPLPADLVQLMEAMQGNQEAMDGFARLYAGAMSPTDFFSPGNIAGILSQRTNAAHTPASARPPAARTEHVLAPSAR
ncbi:NAD(P)/FAD-dependent oxidoreductase [Streptomyces sp. SBC-4]|nr:NAD(P)/FAD-dependent oxidoreductase [Streptomyces sp. SBC-4]MDV5146774.1 NAD(P)/FAD-dependent oxidoreductase [Streptomyces sp. SBC-4]